MRLQLRVVSALAWVISWRIIFLEITRWQHLKPSLRFNPPPTAPGGMRPRPGMPLHFIRVVAVLAPVTFLLTIARSSAKPRYQGDRK